MSIKMIGLVLAAVLVCGCESSGDGGGSDVLGDGVALSGLASCERTEPGQTLLCGTALASDGVTPIVGALVTLSSADPSADDVMLRGVENRRNCLTDTSGEYACLMPRGVSGTLAFRIAAPGFEEVVFVEIIVSGAIVDTGPRALVSDTTLRWAVVPGDFDGVQVLLAQLKGCTLSDAAGNPWLATNPDPASARGSEDCRNKGLHIVDDEFFTDGSLEDFDALFVNCATSLSDGGEIDASVRAFAESGGHIYFSDLSDPWLTAVFPDRIDFAGRDTTTTSNLPAQVVDAGLRSVIGADVGLVFDFAEWTAIESVSDETVVYIEADISEHSSYDGVKPVTVSFPTGAGAGCVFFTSYHIEAASSGSDQEVAIKYLVQNIDSVCAA